MTTALKEWAAAVAALLDGRQTILLRKGGIHEKRFVPPAPGSGSALIPLFPTVAHAHAARVRPEYLDLVAATATDSTAETVTLRAAVTVTDVIEVARPEAIAELEPFHLWTTASVREDRLDFRPRRALTVLVVQAVPLAPVVLRRTPEDSGCRSWVDLPVGALDAGAPAHSTQELAAVAAAVRRAVG